MVDLNEYGWRETTPQALFGSNGFYIWLNTLFANKSHTHTISNITNFPSTMPPSSHSHSLSDITNLSTTYLTQSSASTTYAPISHTHSTWTSVNLNNSYATLYVNEAIRMCDFHYQRDFTSATADTNYSWHTGLIPSDYRPITQATGSFNFLGTLIINTNGNVGGRFATTWTNSSRTVQGSAMWHY